MVIELSGGIDLSAVLAVACEPRSSNGLEPQSDRIPAPVISAHRANLARLLNVPLPAHES
jgi:hypothetical protein